MVVTIRFQHEGKPFRRCAETIGITINFASYQLSTLSIPKKHERDTRDPKLPVAPMIVNLNDARHVSSHRRKRDRSRADAFPTTFPHQQRFLFCFFFLFILDQISFDARHVASVDQEDFSLKNFQWEGIKK